MEQIETLLQPLGGPMGCGEDMSFSHEFDIIRESRREDDANLAQGDWIAEVKLADWESVADLCAKILTTQSKDLRVAGWYAEAEAKQRHFAGLSFGCKVLHGLIEQYWDGIYPEAEDGDQELRIGTLAWFVTRSTELIRQAPLTQSAKGKFSLADFEAARAFESAAEKNPDLRDNVPDNKPTVARITEAQRTTPKDYFRKLLEEVQDARSSWQQLSTSIDNRLGVDGPSFREVFDAFDAVINQATRNAREQGAIAGGPVPEAAAPGAATVADQGVAVPVMHTGAPVVSGPIQSRQQALQLLRQVADFFQATEPHSPVTYLARKAADWGEMHLHEWLATVIKDHGTLSQVQEMLGVSNDQ